MGGRHKALTTTVPLIDNGDIVKALGFVTLYGAYLEESIDLCVEILAKHAPGAPRRIQRWPISEKLKYCAEELEPLAGNNAEVDRLINACSYAAALFEERNDAVHGRIYAGQGAEPDVRKSGRAGIPDRPVTSKELYDLANRLFDACSPFMHGASFVIPRVMK